MNYLEFALFCKNSDTYTPICNVSLELFPKLRKKIISNGTGIIELEMEGDKNNVLVIYTNHFNIIQSQKINFNEGIEIELSRVETIEILNKYFPSEWDMVEIKEPSEI